MIFTGLFPVKYLKGKFYKCMTLDPSIDSELIDNKWDCMDYGGDWLRQDFHWDNMGSSVFNLFVIATCEGWTAFMFEAWDATDVD